MNLNGVNTFIHVVEARSFSRAAENLGITTSGVSRALAKLEDELGIRLLQRTTRKLSLTAAGRAYFDQVKGALAMVDEASAAAAEMGEQPRGSVRLTAPPGLVVWTIPFIAEFQESYPNVCVELSCSQDIVDLVEHGLDLALRIGRLQDSSLIARRVGRLVTGLFASREYIRRKGRPRKPADLAKHNCVLFRGKGGKDTWRLRDTDREYLVDVTGSLDVDDIPSAHQAIAAGIGIGSIALFTSRTIDGVVRVLPRYVYADLPINLVWPSRRLEPARVVLFRDFLAKKLMRLRWGG
jgi:DNA-binding transcriptional LysR family regulator